MSGYAFDIRQAPFEAFLAANKSDRQKLMSAFIWLANNPSAKGENSFYESPSRPVEQKLFGDWLITFWTDHAAKEVRIVEKISSDG